MSKIISKEEFEQLVINSKEPVLVDFYADWCGPCRMLAPIMDEIGNNYTVYKVNTDNEQELSREYGIMSIPCVIAFKDGKEINRSIGLKSKEDIVSMIK